MEMEKWKYYRHAMIPTAAPHEIADVEPFSKQFWRENKSALFARWTSEFDCGYETNWWYVIKDTRFDLSALKSRYRYKINRGIKNFRIQVINPGEYLDELYEVCREALESWPRKYRPRFTYSDAKKQIDRLSSLPAVVCYGAFAKESGELCGFIQVSVHKTYAELQVQRVKPAYERLEINAALLYTLLKSMETQLEKGDFYILDGARNVSHETNFQDYLEKYFSFRKAYCKLHIAYNPMIKRIVKILFPFRKILCRFSKLRFVSQVNSVLYMEELCRNRVERK